MNEGKKSVGQLALHKIKKNNKKSKGKMATTPYFPASRAKPPDPLCPAAFDPACWVDTAFIIMSNPPHLSF